MVTFPIFQNFNNITIKSEKNIFKIICENGHAFHLLDRIWSLLIEINIVIL